jgi:hypothetical protein
LVVKNYKVIAQCSYQFLSCSQNVPAAGIQPFVPRIKRLWRCRPSKAATGSSAAIDLHDKKNVYRRNGVKEYIVWQIFDQRLDWFVLGDDGYSLLQPDVAGVIHSQVFPGLCLAVSTLLEGDLAKVLAALRQNIEQTGKGV